MVQAPNWASNLAGANSALKVRGKAGAATIDLYVGLDLASLRPQPISQDDR